MQTGEEQSGVTDMPHPPGRSGGEGRQGPFGAGSLPPGWVVMGLRLNLASWLYYCEPRELQSRAHRFTGLKALIEQVKKKNRASDQ